jgi:hypothetical protein
VSTYYPDTQEQSRLDVSGLLTEIGRLRAPKSRQPAHIRVVTRRPSRRINGTPGASYTLCGAEPTEFDVLYGQSRRIVTANVAVWPVCQGCRNIYLAVKKEQTR